MGVEQSEQAASASERLVVQRLEPADFFCAATALGAVITALTGALAETAFLLGTFLALVLLRRVRLPTAFELSVAIGIVLQGWGNALLLFERIGWYDKAVHFLTPLLMVPALYLILARMGALPSPWQMGLRRGALGVFVTTLALGFAFAGVWELVEGSSDRLLGTSLAHGYFETIDDLYSSLLGSISGGALLAWLAATDRGLSSTRLESLRESD